jgi:sugar phosphate isomerase/epimerase
VAPFSNTSSVKTSAVSPSPASASRRAFLRHAALLPLAAGAALSLRAPSASAAVAPVKRIGGPALRTGLNAYSFADLLNANLKDPTKGLNLFQVCDYAAQDGFAAIDPTGYFFPGYPKAPTDDYVFALKRHAFDRGLAISGTGVRNDFTTADAAVRAEGVACVKTWVEVAAKLGAPVVRVFVDCQSPHKNWRAASAGAPREAVETWLAAAVRECAEHAKKIGVIIGVQNHGDFVNSAAEHLRVLERVDHASCGLIVDTGKYGTPDPYADIALTAPYAVNWQVKENTVGKADAPRTDMKKLVGLLRRAGYRGYVPIETLAMGRKNYDPAAESTRLHAELRAAIAASGE